VGENLSAGADLCGPNPAVQTDDVWRMQGITLSPAAAQPVSNGLRMKLTGLTAAGLQLFRTGVQLDRVVTLDVTGDGPATLTLAGGWRTPMQVERDGVVIGTVTPTPESVRLAMDFAGHHVIRLIPTTGRGGYPDALGNPGDGTGGDGGTSLPVTGGADDTALVLSLCLLALLAVRRRRAR
jgi:hypothetical protein